MYNNFSGIIATCAMAFGNVAYSDGYQFPSEITSDGELAAFYDRVNSLSMIEDAASYCVQASLPALTQTTLPSHRLAGIYDRLNQGSYITPRISELFQKSGAAVCFMSFQEHFPNMTEAAIHFPEQGVVLLNSDAEEGCQVSAAIHEMQHRIQTDAGFRAPYPDLTVDDQRELVIGVELDAHTIQVIGSLELAYAGEPYLAARDCLYQNRGDEDNFYLYEAARMAEVFFEINPRASSKENVAYNVSEYLSGVKTLLDRYKFGVSFIYMDGYYQQSYTLQDVVVDPVGVGAIHYEPNNYLLLSGRTQIALGLGSP